MRHVTHEWAGEPHASESIKRKDGVEVARNLVPNPSFETGVGGVITSSNASVQTSTFANAIAVGAQALLVTLDAGGGTRHGALQRIPISPSQWGKWLAFSLVARRATGSPGDAILLLEAQQSGSEIARASGSPWDLSNTMNSEQIRRTVSIQVPEGTDRIDTWIRRFSTLTEGQYHTDAWRVSVAETEADALAQVENYFDGDTEDYFSRIVFKVWANGKWRPIEPKAYVDGVYMHGGMS